MFSDSSNLMIFSDNSVLILIWIVLYYCWYSWIMIVSIMNINTKSDQWLQVKHCRCDFNIGPICPVSERYLLYPRLFCPVCSLHWIIVTLGWNIFRGVTCQHCFLRTVFAVKYYSNSVTGARWKMADPKWTTYTQVHTGLIAACVWFIPPQMNRVSIH